VLIITALLISLVAGYRPFRPSLLGKISTFFQMLTIFVAVYSQARGSWAAHLAVHIATYFTLVFTLASGLHYLFTIQKRIGPHPSEGASVTSAGTKSG